mgnify:FL=1
MDGNIINLDKESNPFRVDNLMIGDWIETPNGEMKVREISQNGTVYCGYSTSPSKWEKFTEYEIAPIPIHINHLKDNGFRETENAGLPPLSAFEFKTSKKTVIISEIPSRDSTSWRCTVKLINTLSEETTIVSLVTDYLHELQHILKMVDVETTNWAKSDSY